MTFVGGFKRDLHSFVGCVGRVTEESEGDGQWFESVEQILARVLREFVRL